MYQVIYLNQVGPVRCTKGQYHLPIFHRICMAGWCIQICGNCHPFLCKIKRKILITLPRSTASTLEVLTFNNSCTVYTCSLCLTRTGRPNQNRIMAQGILPVVSKVEQLLNHTQPLSSKNLGLTRDLIELSALALNQRLAILTTSSASRGILWLKSAYAVSRSQHGSLRPKDYVLSLHNEYIHNSYVKIDTVGQ